ncbi:Putative uncharacterized protein [Mesomycoplasma hyopneumoniae 168]|uniref:Transmembrane protein n=2 Tax=Mesomycoplasma hyopneumoniae (strain 168) TaxID=907287 RepID=E4QSF0_MESH1|nr:hypothetical protein [Mesomycoplasma hyopneumoniae]ADQ90361.1 Putative uncharacterized protein [Mesomycoplasma hyopneumoniae 168]AGM21928.1 hypothetical protein MHP168L_144 [Mesomycoplasma hyopneumoniae 168-L]
MTSKIYQNSKISLLISIILLILMSISLYYFFQIKTYRTINFILEIDEKHKTFAKINSDIYYSLNKDSFAQFQFQDRSIRLELIKITNTKQNEFIIEFTKSLLLKPKTQIPAVLFLKDNGNFFDLFIK